MTITIEHLKQLERRHDRLWLCRNLLGEIALLLHESQSVCYVRLVVYRDGVWFDREDVRLARAQVIEIINTIEFAPSPQGQQFPLAPPVSPAAE